MNALELRKLIKKRKPAFDREDSHKINCLKKTGWRRPSGLHSKMRHNYRGQPAIIQPGFGSPRSVRGLHSSGLAPVLVCTQKELEQLNPKVQGAVLSASLGMKKRLALVALAQQKKISILNIRKPEEYVAGVKKDQDEKKARKSAAAKKSVPSQPAKPSQSEKETLTDTTTVDQTKEAQKKELDKMLTRKET